MIRRIPFLLFAAFVVSACTEMATNATGPEEGLPSFARVKTTTGPVCKTIDFSGFSHGDLVTTVASGFGFDITLSVTSGGPRSTTNLRAWDVNTPETGLQDLDLIWNGALAQCPDCEGLGIVILIEDKPGFDKSGDSPDGGFIDLTGFSGHGVFLIRSYVALDQDGDEDAIRLFVDGTEDGASSGLGNGSVETVVPNQKAFTDEARFVIDGSGAVDDIEICQAPEGATGRMTGGGKQTNVDGVSITRGFTIHCDIALSNNIEINWAGGNKWHLDKPLISAECFDDGSLDPVPPASPFDTFIGEGTGRLNGVDGSLLKFVFVDAGEPGRNDRAMIQIWAPGDDPDSDTPVLDVSGFLDRGNIQAHFDQPHKTR